VNEEAHAGYDQHHHARERVKLQSHVDVKMAERPIGKMERARGKPGVKHLGEGMVRRFRQGQKLKEGAYCPHQRQARESDGYRETARFESRRPKRSWIAAPRTGKTGISQM